jgi:glycosyltransferase involved in cell wall biosynthesis
MHENFISKCIEGILMQKTNFDFEIIIHDDASTDNTPLIISKFEQKYPNKFKVIYQFENQYVNFGFENIKKQMFSLSSGKYIAFCEGDDYWIDNYKLQKQVDFLETNKDYIIHSGSAKIIRNNQLTEEIIGSHDFISKSYQLEDFYHQNNLVNCTVMFKNIIDINDSIFFNNTLYGDWYMYVLLLKKTNKKAYRSNELFSVYRFHEKGFYGGMDLFKNYDEHLKHILFLKQTLKYKVFSYSTIENINNLSCEKFKILLSKKKIFSAIKVLLYNIYLTKYNFSLKRYL